MSKTFKEAQKIQDALRRSIEPLTKATGPDVGLVEVKIFIPGTNTTHRFALENTALGHVESWDQQEVLHLFEVGTHLHPDGRRSDGND
jgi:hypothetical protein